MTNSVHFAVVIDLFYLYMNMISYKKMGNKTAAHVATYFGASFPFETLYRKMDNASKQLEHNGNDDDIITSFCNVKH